MASPSALPVRSESWPAYQGGAPGAGLRTSVADVLAVVLVHPEPLVATLAFVTVSVFEPLYLPFILPAFLGKAVMVQPERMLDLKVAPSLGAFRVSVFRRWWPTRIPRW